MKRTTVAVAAFLAVVPLVCHAAAQKGTRAKIDQYMHAAVKVDHFMGAILVAKGGHVVIAKGYGMADLKDRVPNRPDTEFRIGSVTKQFTATAILMLQNRGKLNVEDPVCKYVPKCPKDWRPIKLSNLLTHTSGIPNLTAFKGFDKFTKKPHTPTQVLDYFKNRPLDFKPGAKFSYSNSNYEVLGYIVQKVSGEPYKTFLRQHIFGPLGMKNSGYDSSHPTAKNHAKGYTHSKDGYKPAEYVNMTVPYGAGALYSTVQDLYTWDRALEAGKVLPKPLHEEMFAPHVAIGKSGNRHYGYGWDISTEFGYKRYSHNGGIPGFTSLNSWFPGQHAYVIVLDNTTSPDISAIGQALTAILFGRKYSIPRPFKAISLPPKDLEKFVGKYRITPRFAITISLDGDQLKAQPTGQAADPIYPESKDRFFLKDVRAEIEFVTNAKGEVTGVVLHQNGHQISGHKVKQGP